MPEKTYKKAVSAFGGKWVCQSATRDGNTVYTSDNGADMSLDIDPKSMKATLMFNGKSSEQSWGVTSKNKGYLDNPVNGIALNLDDGILTVDLEEAGVFSFVKES